MDGTASFGRWLKQRRKELDLTQQNLAQRVGCAVVTIKKIEADERRPSHQIARRLAEHLEIDLDERAAFLRFARTSSHTERPALGDPTNYTPPARLPRRRINVPVSLTPLIGRDQDVVTICDRLLRPDVRLVTLLGPPGVGKTHLGIQVATELIDDFEDGVFFVALAPVRDPDLVLTTIAQTLDVIGAGNQPPLARLTQVLQDKRLLLLLDNFEQVSTAARYVIELLTSCRWLKVLVTSRAALHVRGEQQFPVEPLLLPDLAAMPTVDVLTQYPAIALFIERARAIRSSFILTEKNAATVMAICRQLDGLPLAIELVAVYAKLFQPEILLAQLNRRLTLSALGATDLPARQQTLRNAIDWSYELLDAQERRLFARLAVFMGGWTLEAAAKVCNVAGDLTIDVMEGVMALLNKSLLQQQKAISGESRFTMLETIREYTSERLAASDEIEVVRRQHAAFFLALAEAAEPMLRGPEQMVWMVRLDVEHDNLRAALEWSCATNDGETGLRLVGALCWFWHRRGYVSEGRSWTERILKRVALAQRTSSLAKALQGGGMLACLQADYLVAQAWLEESLAIWQLLEKRVEMADTLNYLGLVALFRGDIETAHSRHQTSLTILREMGDRWSLAFGLKMLGTIARFQGAPISTRDLYMESLSFFREVGDQWGIAVVLNDLGEAARTQGTYEQAARFYEESLIFLRGMGDRWLLAIVLHNLGYVAQHQGDHNRAVVLIEESLTLWRDLGNQRGIGLCVAALAGVAVQLGHLERAARLFGSAEAIFETVDHRMEPADQIEFDRNVALARTQLSEATFAASWADGRRMTLDQVIAFLFPPVRAG